MCVVRSIDVVICCHVCCQVNRCGDMLSCVLPGQSMWRYVVMCVARSIDVVICCHVCCQVNRCGDMLSCVLPGQSMW